VVVIASDVGIAVGTAAGARVVPRQRRLARRRVGGATGFRRAAVVGVVALTLLGCSSAQDATPQPGPPGGSYPNGSEPPEGLIAAPLDHLVDGQRVNLRGHGFAAGETVLVVQCTHEVLAEGPKACDAETMVKALVDGRGEIAEPFTVRRRITAMVGADTVVVDCGERASRCNISGAAATDITRASGTGISFAEASSDPTGTTPTGSTPSGR
jgi:hypothetical protein